MPGNSGDAPTLLNDKTMLTQARTAVDYVTGKKARLRNEEKQPGTQGLSGLGRPPCKYRP